jgi:16S rRNA (uracil1498-N3)-methyltransferase
MPAFHCFDSEILPDAKTWTLGREESHHLIKVLRANPKDQITILNGKGLRLTGYLQTPNPKGAMVQIETSEQTKQSPKKICLAIGIPKIKTLDILVRQATELGVAKILLLNSERSETPKSFFNSVDKLDKLLRTAKEACKQSENPFLPEILLNASLLNWLNEFSCPGEHWVAHPTRTHQISVPQSNAETSDQWLLIGPEGGLTEEEFEFAQGKGFQPIHLGSNILRVETACVTLTAIARYSMPTPKNP